MRKKSIKKYKVIFKKRTKYGTVAITTRGVIILSVIAIVITAVVTTILAGKGGFFMDGIVSGRGENKTQEELQAELQQLTDDSMFRVKLNQRPKMNTSTGNTNILVQNSVENTYIKKVLYYFPEGKTVYETRELYPGEEELSVNIPGDWQIGEHKILADIIAIDAISLEQFVVSTMDIILTVK